MDFNFYNIKKKKMKVINPAYPCWVLDISTTNKNLTLYFELHMTAEDEHCMLNIIVGIIFNIVFGIMLLITLIIVLITIIAILFPYSILYDISKIIYDYCIKEKEPVKVNTIEIIKPIDIDQKNIEIIV